MGETTIIAQGEPSRTPDSEAGPSVPATPTLVTRARHLIRQHLAISILLALGAVLRLLFMIAYPPAFWFHGDSGQYIQLAHGALEPHPNRPLGYSALLKLLQPTGTHLAVVALQHMISLLFALGIYVLLQRRGLPRWLSCLAALPLLFDSLALTMGHYMLPDLLFTALFAGAVLLLLGPNTPGYPAVIGSGLLIVAAWITKPTALPVALLLGLYLLARRVGWRRLVGYALAVLVPYVSMIVWIGDRQSVYGAQSATALYGRTAIIADCDHLRLTPDERIACPDQPLGERWDRADAFFWRRPARLGDVTSEAGSQRLVNFSMAVLRQQPLDYLGVVAKESAAHFVPGLYLGPMNECLRERLVPPVQFRGPGRVTDRCPPAQASPNFGGGATWPGTAPGATPLTKALHHYGEFFRLGPVVLLIGLLLTVGAFVARRRRDVGRGSRARVDGRIRLDLLLLALAGPGLTVLTVMVGMYEPRYALPALPLSAVAAVLAWHGLRTPPGGTSIAAIPGPRGQGITESEPVPAGQAS
ncbi:hypothetical protein ACI2K4_00825 [Micromonospora sp. NPDC050397]|uniref:hypothetical protein n=1 Tax=Micromonospora sp. NPDC050397 TaxID=3364279 RepID=UPI00384E3843